MIRLLLVALFLAGTVGVSGCATSSTQLSSEVALAAFDEEGAAEDDDDGRSFLLGALLYLPNRVFDALDPVRFGVDVGPGVGVDARVTKLAQGVALFRTSVGVGYQTLRHLPVHFGAETRVGVGPAVIAPEAGLPWYRSSTDARFELHLLLVGGHVAVDAVEILDLALGFLTIDIKGDDF